MNIHFVIHESFEAPGAFLRWIKTRGHDASFSRVYEGEALPSSLEHIDLLVVMGGPQSPATTKAECAHFDGPAEMQLIRDAIAAKKAVLGVCLGAQLLGDALGGQHDRSPEKEIGNFPIQFTADALKNPLFSHFSENALVGHWHGDMPGLTANSRILASSQGCPRQIIEYGDLVYGFQCHMEFNEEQVGLLIEHSAGELEAAKGRTFVQSVETLRSNNYESMNEGLYQFLDKLTAAQARRSRH